MKFSVDIVFNNKNELKLPLTYRKDIVSLVKEALKLENPNYFEFYYGDKSKNRQKPFTFSVYLPQVPKETDKNVIVLQNNKLSLHFSSNDYSFFISVYNGLLKVKNFKLFKSDITIKHFYLKKEISIVENKMIFKTYSPILLRNIDNKKGNGFLEYRNPQFIEQAKYSIKNLVDNFSEMKIDINQINFIPLKMKSDIVSLYGGEIGNTGIFSIEAPIGVLKLVYDLGLGAKRSQGFGMIEVLG